MREIKFRYWDTESKNMAYSPVELRAKAYKFLWIYACIDNALKTPEIEVMQYTSLKDRNGKEIYEGDIILWGDNMARERGTALKAIVEFNSGCFGITSENDNQFHEFYHYDAKKWGDKPLNDADWGEMPIQDYFRSAFEVIGNIYENPELLRRELPE